MRVAWERAEAPIPRSALITGGFHNRRCFSPWGAPLQIRTPVVQNWLGDFGTILIDYSVPISIALAIPVMLAIGIGMERGLIKHFYKRSHAEQILVTFGLAIVLQEIVKAFYGANPIPQPTPQ